MPPHVEADYDQLYAVANSVHKVIELRMVGITKMLKTLALLHVAKLNDGSVLRIYRRR